MQRQQIDFLAGVVGCATIFAFAVTLFTNQVPLNVASWGLWTILNGVNYYAMVNAGNKKQAWLPAGYALGAAAVTVMVLFNGTWSWGWIETTALVGAMVALLVSHLLNKRAGILFAIGAMLIASVPMIHDNWIAPEVSTWWLWGGCLFSSTISSIVARGWTIEDRAYPVTGVAMNVLMITLVLRPI